MTMSTMFRTATRVRCSQIAATTGAHHSLGMVVANRSKSSNAATGGQRVVVVTGGAAGIGLGIVESFAAVPNTRVYFADIDATEGLKLDERLSNAQFIHTDIGQAVECKKLVDTVMSDAGRIDVLVNNAGIQPPASCVPLHELSEEYWNKILAVNLSPVYHLGRQIMPIMMKQHHEKKEQGSLDQNGGVVLNIASVQGIQSQKCVPAYAASKGGVLSLTRQMAMDYGEYGIRVLAINPGTIRTPLVDALLKDAGTNFEEAGKPYPLQNRVGEINEIGDVAVFLASDKASFMHGVNITVDGGITISGGWAT